MSISPTRSDTRLTLWLLGLSLVMVITASVLFIAKAQTGTLPPVLLSQETSTRAIALNATTFVSEPFGLTTVDPAGVSHRTRILLFAMNMAGSDLSKVTATAEDVSGRRYPLIVEHVGPIVVGQNYVTQIMLRLNDEMGALGDVLVQVTYNGVASNRVRVGIGQIGGGPPDDNGAVPTPGPYTPSVHNISGRVTKSSGGGLGGATVALSGFTTASTVTDATGAYSFTNLAEGGIYTVTATRTNYTVSPLSQSFTNLRANPTANFVATPVSYTLGGWVLHENATLSGATISLSGSQSATTTSDGNGNYAFTVPAEGDYTLTASYLNYTFNPSSFNISNLSSNRTVNFTTVKPQTYAISGRIAKSDAVGLPGTVVTVSGTGFTTASTITDATGAYSFPNLAEGGNYTVTATHANYTLSPPNQSFTNLRANATANFVATPVNYILGGQVMHENGILSGATISLSGSQSATTTTDTNGNYSFAVPAQGDYTLTPTHLNYNFSPSSFNVSNLSSNRTVNFTTVKPQTYAISGRIAKSDAVGLPGTVVTVSGTGFTTASTITDATGAYSFPNLAEGGNYTVTATRVNYTVSPLSQSFTNLRANATANFVATPVSYVLSGRVIHENGTLSGVTISLSGSQSATTTTDTNGTYEFTVPAEGDYTLTPTHLNYTFNPSSFNVSNLSSNRTVNFTTVKPQTYAISGRVARSDGTGLSNVAVTVSGTGYVTSSTLTDATGNYSFPVLSEGGNYTVTATGTYYYTVSPPNQSFTNLRANATANFVATTANYTISGRVTDYNIGFSGVTVTLSGYQSATLTTDTNGNYEFTVPAGGNYVVTPSIECCKFDPPSQAFNNLTSNQTANFTRDDSFYVLDFDGSPQTVEFPSFWGDGDLGHFFWEFWAMPGNAAGQRYLISDGYGGAHAILFGMGSDNGNNGRYTLFGNIWNGTAGTNFGSDDGPSPFEWGHMAVGWDGQHIVTYYNGIPVGSTPFSGPRRALLGGGGGTLYIGGSDHQNFIGRISQARGYEGSNPHADFAGNGASRAAFHPQTLFGGGGSFLVSFLRPSQNAQDLSGGRTGRIRGIGYGANDPRQTYPAPQFMVDLTAPTAATNTRPVPPSVNVDTPPPTPANARVFDSFSRRNVTRAFDSNEGLGSTEGGSVGKQAWEYYQATRHLPPAFGILNGRAVILNNEFSVAAVSTGTGAANLHILVDRRPGAWGSGISTGLAFRVSGPTDFFYAYTNGESALTQRLTVGYYVGSTPTNLGVELAMPAAWTTLHLLTLESGGIWIYADGTLVYSGTSPIHATAKKAGLYNASYGRGLSNRWDNFTVKNAP